MSRATTLPPGDRAANYAGQTARRAMTGRQAKRWRQKRHRWNLTPVADRVTR